MERITGNELARVSETSTSGSNLGVNARNLEIKGLLGIAYQAQALPIPDDISIMAEAYSLALIDIPDERLRACFVRAIQARRDGFIPASGDVLTEWEVLREELRREGEQHAENELLRLKAGHGSLGLMTRAEWKKRHNLPDTWKLGQPYPPESDLYGKPLPPRDVPWGGCDRCADAGWLVNRDTPKHPVLTKCPDCNGTGKAGYAAPY